MELLTHWLKQFHFKRVNQQIFVLMILIITIPLAVMSWFIYLFSVQSIKNEYQNSANLILNNLSFNIDQYLQSIEKGTLNAQLDSSLQDSLYRWLQHPEEDQNYQYRNVIEQFVSTIEITIKNVDSVQIYAGNRVFYSADFNRYSYVETDFLNKPWYQEILKGKGKIVLFGTHTPFHRIGGEQEHSVISIGRVINITGSKQPLGVILVDLRPDSLKEILSLSENSNQSFIIVDEKGSTVYASARDYKGKTEVDGEETMLEKSVLEQVTKQSSGNFYASVQGTPSYINFVTSDYSGWKVIQYVDEKQMTKNAEFLRFILLGFAVCTLLVALLFLAILSARVTKPIILLSRQVRAVGSGNLNIQLNTNRKDEFGILYQGISNMAEDLKNNLEKTSDMLAQQKLAQYGALKSQINPHFLANALESIQMKAVISGQRDIGEMVGLLGRMFRVHIQTGKELVPLEEELAHTRLYIQIQQMRFGDKIKYRETCDPAVLQLPVVHFSLQPLIENAIVHGLEQKKGTGNLEVTAEIVDQVMCIEIRDDGAGISEDQLLEIRNKLYDPASSLDMDHIGIKNVHDRIQYHFGDPYGLHVESSSAGTKITILYPAHHSHDFPEKS
ncbi:sensor histidine kinase [Paenibacillus polygoni]|uniref:Sensor histidine kinase n=1 Tax=Paenibacillus polygoni TaxID=3050112 RepID=A0ABY8WXY6_9BACL|nr:sensor histidine kinase [Paenibacillus polygoni]WIV17533.1 sensor histidine kinase [Paenibacillus polygoni]